jgi:hypothetical protein
MVIDLSNSFPASETLHITLNSDAGKVESWIAWCSLGLADEWFSIPSSLTL